MLPGLLSMHNKRPQRTRAVAMGGVFSALALVIMLAGGYIPVGTFAAPIFAGLCIVPIGIDIGPKWAILSYVAVAVLAALLVPDLELVLFFVVLLGYYPQLQPRFLRLRSKILRTAAKLLLFNLSVTAVYSAMLFLFTSPALQTELAGRVPLFWAFLLLLANLTFVLYDILLDKFRILYALRIRGRLFR